MQTEALTLQTMDFSIDTIHAGYRQGLFTPVDVVREALRRIRARGQDFVWTELVAEERALAAAQKLLDQSLSDPTLPLYGLPFSVKDNVDVASMRTTCGCAGFDHMPTISATAVEKALQAGAILIGKNTLDQFATGLNGTRMIGGQCRNAFNPDYVSGGSSSGSGVAVAAELVTFSLGSDTGGSGRVPAAMNNVVGIKPTLGLVSGFGLVYNNRYLDCVPVFAPTVEDAFTVLRAIRGYDAQDAFTRADADTIALEASVPAQFTFGVPRRDQLQFFGDTLAEAAFNAAVENMQRIGGTPVEIDYTLFIEAGRLPFESGLLAERSVSYGGVLDTAPDTVHPAVATMIQRGLSYSGVDTMRAIYRMMELRRDAKEILRDVLLLVTPTVGRAYKRSELDADPIGANNNIGFYTYPVSPMDLCAVAVPASIRPDGLPFGVSLVAPAGQDGVLYEIGKRFAAQAGVPPGIRAQVAEQKAA